MQSTATQNIEVALIKQSAAARRGDGSSTTVDEYPFISRLNFFYQPAQRKRFRAGELVPLWNKRYPGLFDREDLRLHQSQPTFHYFEWLASVLLHEATGYFTLMEKYETARHTKKIKCFREIAGPRIFDDVMSNRSGVPDLFVYSPDRTDWFFCEVKGAADRLRCHQIKRFEELAKVSKRKVCVLSLKEKRL